MRGWGSDPYSVDSDADNCPDGTEAADVDGNRQANIADVVWVAKMAFSLIPPRPALDLNKDSAWNIADVVVVARNSTLVRPHNPCP